MVFEYLLLEKPFLSIQFSPKYLTKSRTSQDMDGALYTDFSNFKAFLQLSEKNILTKFEGCDSKIRPAMLI